MDFAAAESSAPSFQQRISDRGKRLVGQKKSHNWSNEDPKILGQGRAINRLGIYFLCLSKIVYEYVYIDYDTIWVG